MNHSLIPFKHWRYRVAKALVLTILVLFALAWRPRPQKLLWLTPRTGGINNQLISVYEAFHCARKYHRKVVLPLIFENVRADTTAQGTGPYPFQEYYDLEKLRDIARITTLDELESNGIPCNKLFFSTSRHFMASSRRIPRLIKQHYTKRFPINDTFISHTDIAKNKHRTCWDDSLCSRSDLSEFGAYSDYMESGQGYNIRKSSTFLRIREAFQPALYIIEIAEGFLTRFKKPFNAIHLRRGDFLMKCAELPTACDEYGYNAFVQTKEYITIKLGQFRKPQLPLFITTTHKEDCQFLLQDVGVPLLFLEDFYASHAQKLAINRTEILSVTSQVVATEAEEFIGNRFSSFTTEINNMRYLKGKREQLKFF